MALTTDPGADCGLKFVPVLFGDWYKQDSDGRIEKRLDNCIVELHQQVLRQLQLAVNQRSFRWVSSTSQQGLQSFIPMLEGFSWKGFGVGRGCRWFLSLQFIKTFPQRGGHDFSHIIKSVHQPSLMWSRFCMIPKKKMGNDCRCTWWKTSLVIF